MNKKRYVHAGEAESVDRKRSLRVTGSSATARFIVLVHDTQTGSTLPYSRRDAKLLLANNTTTVTPKPIPAQTSLPLVPARVTLPIVPVTSVFKTVQSALPPKTIAWRIYTNGSKEAYVGKFKFYIRQSDRFPGTWALKVNDKFLPNKFGSVKEAEEFIFKAYGSIL